MKDAEYWIKHLKMEPHKEGGYCTEIIKSDDEITLENQNKRKLYSSIYFLLEKGNPSHFHSLTADEIWYYHAGSPLSVHVIFNDGAYKEIKIGDNPENGEVLQAVVPKGAIFGSSVENGGEFSVVGCMVSPAFEYSDFRLYSQKELLEIYPQHRDIILKLAYKKVPKI